MVLERLAEEIDRLLEVDAQALSAGELHDLVVEVHRQASRLAAASTQLVGAWDARRIWADNGSKSAPARLARECKVAGSTASCEVRRSRKLRSMPHTSAAFADGRLSADQVDVLARTNQARLADQFAEFEEELVAHAQRLSYRDLERVARYWQQHADAAAAEDAARRQHEGREVHASRTFRGSVDLRGYLDPVGGTIFLRELQRLEQEMFDADWADARAEHGEQATVEDLRSHAGPATS